MRVSGTQNHPAWEASHTGLNRTLLLARDPILLYASLPLYVSELDDHGLSVVDCKVRVEAQRT